MESYDENRIETEYLISNDGQERPVFEELC